MNISEKIELANGSVKWLLPNGNYHRTDGPALTYPNGYVEYWIEGTKYDPITFLIKSYEYTNKT